MNICHNVSVLWPNGWTDQDDTWHAGRPRPWPYCVRWGPSSPQGGGRFPNFRPISIVTRYIAGWIKMALIGMKDWAQATLC